MIFMFRIPGSRICWISFSFLFGTLLLSLTAVPIYLIVAKLAWYQILYQLGLFLLFFIATGMSITFGYHRLFAHKSFETAKWVRAIPVFFGAAAFENSVLSWASDHRNHHKHTDHEHDDPYSITNGFWYAHIGWILFKQIPSGPFDNVKDLEKDKLLVWQHKNWFWIGGLFGFVLPTAAGALCGALDSNASIGMAALGGFLIGGVLKTVCVQHSTFFINSLCHYIGKRPYNKTNSARDSWIMALFTFGEGYHNYHHEFQWDYRNGVKKWQFDPTKWTIWGLSKLGLAQKLRRVPDEKILEAQEKAREEGRL